MATEPIFPAEIILHILGLSSARDVVRWRSVSKWFKDITYDSVLWIVLYANSHLPRPPGPFSSQSTADLEQTLVRTEKLAQSWTTRAMRDTPPIELQVEQQPDGAVKLLGGRWLVGCESSRRFVLYDVDPSARTNASQRQVIWEEEELVESWDVSSVTTEDGQFVVYVLCGVVTRWRLLQFQLNSQSCKLCGAVAFDLPAPVSEDDVELVGGNSPFLYIPGQEVVFDTRTRIFYDFPVFEIAREETLSQIVSGLNIFQGANKSVVLTNTHVITLHGFSPLFEAFPTLIQAFTVPPEGSLTKNNKDILRLSHEGIAPHLHHATLLRNSIIDPVTGSTTVRLSEQRILNRHVYMFCNDLTLPKSIGNEVSPTILEVDQGVEANYQLHQYTLVTSPCYVECSDEGHLRAFLWREYLDYSLDDSLDDLQDIDAYPMMKFTIDATQRQCIYAFGQPLSPWWDHIQDPCGKDISFDGTRGRLCFVKSRDRNQSAVVVVVDIN